MVVSKKLHRDMVDKVMDAPINLYFDVTPMGRILNKFSKDISLVDRQIPFSFGNLFVTLYQAVAVVGFAIVIVPWSLLIFPITAVICVKLLIYSMSSYRETARIESVTKSPLLSFF